MFLIKLQDKTKAKSKLKAQLLKALFKERMEISIEVNFINNITFSKEYPEADIFT